MTRTMIALVLALLLASGCSTTREVGMDQSDRWMADAQDDLLRKYVTVTMVDGSVAEGKLIMINADSLSLQGSDGPIVRTEALDRVRVIRPSRKVLPVIGGFVGGTLVGGVIGSQIGAASEEPRIEMLGLNTLANTAGGGMAGGILGAVAGTVGVALLTSVTDYHLYPSQSYRPRTGASEASPDSVRKGK